jgi:DNA-binding transcriptional MerR regulator
VDEEQMQIGEVAERTGLSTNTIRHYDQSDLVTPSARSEGGFRLYTETDVDRLLVIRRMKPLGFSLEQMRELLDATDRLTSPARLTKAQREGLHQVVRRYQDLVKVRRGQLVAELAFADDFIRTLDRLSSTV